MERLAVVQHINNKIKDFLHVLYGSPTGCISYNEEVLFNEEELI